VVFLLDGDKQLGVKGQVICTAVGRPTFKLRVPLIMKPAFLNTIPLISQESGPVYSSLDKKVVQFFVSLKFFHPLKEDMKFQYENAHQQTDIESCFKPYNYTCE
jgi:hypothetical protein